MTFEEHIERVDQSNMRWGLPADAREVHKALMRDNWAALPAEKRAALEKTMNINAASTVEEVIAHLRQWHESDMRPDALASWAEGGVDRDTFWAVTRETWNECDRIPHERFEGLFARYGADDYIKRRSLPRHIGKTVTVWRGQGHHQEVGLSWTLSREVAEKFARGLRFRNRYPIVFRRRVSRDDILFCDDSRNEQEVVLRAWDVGDRSTRWYIDGTDVTRRIVADIDWHGAIDVEAYWTREDGYADGLRDGR